MEDDYKLFEPIQPKVTATKNPVYELAKMTGNAIKITGQSIIADTPLWAKVVRLVSLGVIAAGMTLAQPVAAASIFVSLVPYATTIQTVGFFGTLIAQIPSKNKK